MTSNTAIKNNESSKTLADIKVPPAAIRNSLLSFYGLIDFPKAIFYVATIHIGPQHVTKLGKVT
jgi:hypothetical protein